MTLARIVAALVTAAALASYLNYRFIRLPPAIGPMAIALVFSIGLVLAGAFTPLDVEQSFAFIARIDFSGLLLHGMLPFLLFAGALQVDVHALRSEAWTVSVLPTIGVVLATVVIGTLLWLAAAWLGLALDWTEGLLFGALIAPTDPIAVLGILRKARVPRSLEAMIAGESLFNDGIGVVAFLALLEAVETGAPPTPVHIAVFLLAEAVGGIAFGVVLGFIGYRLLRTIDDHPVEIFLTLGFASGGYALAEAIGVSAPLAIVAAGLFIGSVGRRAGMSTTTRRHLDAFWEVLDEMLNAVLFLLVGLELVVAIDLRYLGLAALAVVIVLVGRAASVAVPLYALRRVASAPRGAVAVLTWGGLRGAISLALAMSLPAGHARDVVLTVTYVVVAFSILVQGLTLHRVIGATTDRAP